MQHIPLERLKNIHCYVFLFVFFLLYLILNTTMAKFIKTHIYSMYGMSIYIEENNNELINNYHFLYNLIIIIIIIMNQTKKNNGLGFRVFKFF